MEAALVFGSDVVVRTRRKLDGFDARRADGRGGVPGVGLGTASQIADCRWGEMSSRTVQVGVHVPGIPQGIPHAIARCTAACGRWGGKMQDAVRSREVYGVTVQPAVTAWRGAGLVKASWAAPNP